MLLNSKDINKDTREKALKRLEELAKKSESELIHYPDGRVYRNDELIAEDPTDEQKEWIRKRNHGPARSWEVWDQND